MQWFKEKSTEFYVAWIHALIWRRNIKIERNGGYVEKQGCDPQRTNFVCSCISNYSFTKEKDSTFWLTLVKVSFENEIELTWFKTFWVVLKKTVYECTVPPIIRSANMLKVAELDKKLEMNCWCIQARWLIYRPF